MVHREITRSAVVLAAGLGSRMRVGGYVPPKPLIPLLGRPLLWWTLTGLELAGIERIVVVTGSRAEEVRSWVESRSWSADVDVILNPNYRLGNGVSARCGIEAVDCDSAVMTMADHIVEPSLYELARGAAEHADLVLVVDSEGTYLNDPDDPTRVLVDEEGRIRRIGKGIQQWNSIDTGVFRVGERFSTAVAEVMSSNHGHCTVTDAVNWMIDRGLSTVAADSDGGFWMDIDTPEDLHAAEQIIVSDLGVLYSLGPRMEIPELSQTEMTESPLEQLRTEGYL